MRKFKPEYEIGDPVEFECKLWYITGIQMKFGYNLVCFEYRISDCYNDFKHGGPEYTKSHPKMLRAEQLGTIEDFKTKQIEAIEKQQLELERQLERIKKAKIELL